MANDYEPQVVKVPARQAERITAELVRRLGLNPEQVVAGSLTMDWDASGARVRWVGSAALSSEEAAGIVAGIADE